MQHVLKVSTVRHLLQQLEKRLLEYYVEHDVLGTRFVIDEDTDGRGGIRVELWNADDRQTPIAVAELDAAALEGARLALALREEREQ